MSVKVWYLAGINPTNSPAELLEQLVEIVVDVDATNNTGSTIAANTLVYLNGSAQMFKSDLDPLLNLPAKAMTLESVPDGTTTKVRMFGVVRNLSGLTTLADYYANPLSTGAYQDSVPASGLIQRIGRAVSTTELFLNFDKEPTSGSAFPNSPVTGRLFYHTGYKLWAFYDGTRWLSVNEYQYQQTRATISAATGATALQLPVFTDMFFTRFAVMYDTGATNDGTNYWTFTLRDNGSNTIYTFNTSTDATNTGDILKNVDYTSFTNNPLATSSKRTFVTIVPSVTGGPSNLVTQFLVYWRKVLT